MRNALIALLFAGAACTDDDTDPPLPCPTGHETCACHSDGSCSTGLVCASNTCVRLAGDPVGGDPTGGDPIAGDPASGDPLPGDSLSGDPIAECQKFDTTNTDALEAWEETAPVTWTARTMDRTCLTDPPPTGAFCTLQLQINDFEENEFLVELGGTTVKVYPANELSDDGCDPPATAGSCPGTTPTCYQADANPDGTVEFPCIPCNTRVAIWTFKESAITPVTKPAVQPNIWVDATVGTQNVFTVAIRTFSLIPGVVGFQPNPELGMVWPHVTDCAGHTVSGARINAESGDLTTPVYADFCGTDAIYAMDTAYSVNRFPSAQPVVTTEDGIGLAVNVPPGRATLFASGRWNDSGTLAVVGHRAADVRAGTITLLPLTLTSESADADPPTVVATSPADQATNVAVDTLITATFSEALIPATVTALSFTVSGASGAVTYEGPTFTATFAPTSTLDAGTQYQATLSADIRDTAGNALGAPVVWSFTTAP